MLFWFTIQSMYTNNYFLKTLQSRFTTVMFLRRIEFDFVTSDINTQLEKIRVETR